MTATIPVLTLRPINLDWAHIAASVEHLQYFKPPRPRPRSGARRPVRRLEGWQAGWPAGARRDAKIACQPDQKDMTMKTARCPVCHRAAPLELAGIMSAHKSGSRQCSGSGLEPTAKARSVKEIAEDIIRDCRQQDETTGQTDDPAAQIEGWERAAGAAGDRLVIAAIHVLGRERAAEVYALPGQPGGTRDKAEERRLLAAAGMRVAA